MGSILFIRINILLQDTCGGAGEPLLLIRLALYATGDGERSSKRSYQEKLPGRFRFGLVVAGIWPLLEVNSSITKASTTTVFRLSIRAYTTSSLAQRMYDPRPFPSIQVPSNMAPCTEPTPGHGSTSPLRSQDLTASPLHATTQPSQPHP